MQDEGYGAPPSYGREVPGAEEPSVDREGTAQRPRPGLPWERRDQEGFAAGLLRTCSRVIFAPADAFRAMRQTGGWGDPIGFALIVGTVSTWIGQLWQTLARSLLATRSATMAEEVAMQNLQEIAFAVAAPLLVLVSTAIAAGIAHVFLLLFGGAPQPFETTFRVMAYSWAVNLFNLIPLCGAVAAVVWGIVVRIIGLRDAHEVSAGRAAAAVLVPMVLACMCLVAVVLLLGLALLGLEGVA